MTGPLGPAPPGLPSTVAVCGQRTLPDQVWRPGDPYKHLGPPAILRIPETSPMWSTRCGKRRTSGFWQPCPDDDDLWCPACLNHAGIAHEIQEM